MAEQTYRARSWLFTPATRPKLFGKAADAGADVQIIDLEDAVAHPEKEQARQQALAFLADGGDENFRRALRINSLDTMHGLADLVALLHANITLDVLVLPKVESPDQITNADRLLASIGSPIRLVALIESARGLHAVDQIALSASRLAALMFGAADMSADLGCTGRWDALLFARSKIIAASALAGLAAIDSPFFDIRNSDGLQQEIGLAKGLGFSGKAAVHPDQVQSINDMFVPDVEEVRHARMVLARVEDGVAVIDGQMIDEAMARKARRIIAMSGADARDLSTGEP